MRSRPPARRITLGIAALVAVVGSLLTGEARAVDPLTSRVSVSTAGDQGDSHSHTPSVSASGRFVSFESDATNLVSGDSNGARDVFVRDRQTGETRRVSVSSGGVQGNSHSSGGVISPDGKVVAFHSDADNLVPGDGNGVSDVFVHVLASGQTERVSVSSAGAEGNGGSFLPAVSWDGNRVAFTSDATNIVTPDNNGGIFDVFVRNRSAGTTTRASEATGGAQGNANSGIFNVTISGDGNVVIFDSEATDLVANDTNAKFDVFARNLSQGTTDRVSTSAGGGQLDGDSGFSPGDASADGRYVIFDSAATNAVPNDTNGVFDAFRKDRMTGAVTRLSVSSSGEQGNSDSTITTLGLSLDGRFGIFDSAATNLVSGDGNGFVDVFVHDVLTGETIRTSVGSDADGVSIFPDLAPGNLDAAFGSTATNLVSGDSNGVFDTFVRQFRKANGYFVLDNQGGIFTFGGATFQGSVPGLRAAGVPVGSAPIVDLEVTPSGNGYYVLDRAGGIFTFGDAQFFGSVPGLAASGIQTGGAPILDMAVTPSGQGYLILDSAGGIFTFGDAQFFGSIPQLRQSGVPVGPAQGVDLAITPSGNGYLILDNLGGIFTFGDGRFFGSLPGLRNAGVQTGNAPAIRLAMTPSGDGYLVLDSVGGMFTFGDAQFFGSLPGLRNAGVPIGPSEGVDLAITPTGRGYLVLDNVGGIFTFGDAEFFGSVPALRNAGVPIGPNTSMRLDLVSDLIGG